jgi:phage tail sheath protein FI
MPSYRTPGVYRTELYPPPPVALRTGVPAFLGVAGGGPANTPVRLDEWPDFEETFGYAVAGRFLADAVRGFFANEGALCHVVRLGDGEPVAALQAGLAALEPLDEIDLVCAPDATTPLAPGEIGVDAAQASARVQSMQQALLGHCDRLGDRFAVLDSLPNAGVDGVLAQRRRLAGVNGALYYPWLRPDAAAGFVPPCGHVAGVFARTDNRAGVHKAPANEVLQGVLDLALAVSDEQQALLNPVGVNCLRAFPGRGIRVWGARTVSADPQWRYVSVRRLFLTVGRWLARALPELVYEPNDPSMWARIEREVGAYLDELFRQGAFAGATAEQAYYVKCDAETNQDLAGGRVVAEVGLAAALPNEFVVVYVIHEPGGVPLVGPVRPGQGGT